MRLQAFIAGLIALSAGAPLTACAHTNGSSSGPSTAPLGVTAAMPDDRPISGAVGTPAVERAEPVERFEQRFEALSDACGAADWSYAEVVLRTAGGDWSSIEPVESSAGSPRALLDDIALNLRMAERAVTDHNRRSCLSEAEGLSLAATKLGPPMPPGEAHRVRLRAWLRRVDADARYRDFDAAGRDVARAEDEWRQLAASAPATEAASSFEAGLAACKGAVDEHAPRPLRHAAHAALDALH
jgi:hypothetical protein